MDGLPSHEEWFGIHITHKNGLENKKSKSKPFQSFQYVQNII
jgi:hypothetical protein